MYTSRPREGDRSLKIALSESQHIAATVVETNFMFAYTCFVSEIDLIELFGSPGFNAYFELRSESTDTIAANYFIFVMKGFVVHHGDKSRLRIDYVSQ